MNAWARLERSDITPEEFDAEFAAESEALDLLARDPEAARRQRRRWAGQIAAASQADRMNGREGATVLVNGQVADLKHLKANNGTLPTFNSNYGQPTGYQLPLFMRFGWRLTF